MTIQKLDLQRFDDGQYSEHFLQKTVNVSTGIGNTSDAYRVVTAKSLKVHLFNCTLYESLDTEAAVENDTAQWKFIGDSDSDFALSRGASYLYIENTSDSEEAVMTITGV